MLRGVRALLAGGVFLTAGIAITASPAGARDIEYDRMNVYGGAGISFLHPVKLTQDLRDAGAGRVNASPSAGLNVLAGFRILPNLAIEGQYEANLGQTIDLESVEVGKSSGWATTVNVRVPVMTGQFQPYVLAGVGAANTKTRISSGAVYVDQDTTDFAWRAGGGVEIYVGPAMSFDVGVSYLRPSGGGHDADFLSAGLKVIFHFGVGGSDDDD